MRYPQPARSFSGAPGKVPSTSGRAPSTNVESPMKTKPLAPPGSDPIGSRQISTLAISMPSSAHPVTGIAPAIPVRLFAGVSNDPEIPLGAEAKTFRLMPILTDPFTASGDDTVIVPEYE